ncbi:MAG: endonuclease/exonuclease/phosphatase family protein, partial [Tannerella sp.]|nr:endonuclease/exonuclease/phosphatase family protein [Tannerella sp.]
MKNLFLTITVFAVSSMMVACESSLSKNQIKVISYNIRMCGNPDESDGENCWNKRKQASLNMLNEEKPTVFGIQEGEPLEIAYLDSFMTGYSHIGVGRDDGVAKGEMMAIYYSKSEVELLDNGTFWLSDTPTEVSFGWDAACKRTCTWAFFKLKKTGDKFLYFNTHFDHKGQQAREESIKLMVAKLKEMAPAGMPVVITADFNSTTDNPIFLPLKAVMKDARTEAPATDNRDTFNGWGKGNSVIDHIFYNNMKPLSFKVLRDKNYGAPYISDHYPIVMTA